MRARVRHLSRQARLQEDPVAQTIANSSKTPGRLGELRSLLHDPARPRRARYFRTLGLSMRSAFGGDGELGMGILDLDVGATTETCYRYSFRNRKGDREHSIYLMADTCRMSWAKQSPITRPGDWCNWKERVGASGEGCARPRIEYAKKSDVPGRIPLSECQVCKGIALIPVGYYVFGGIAEQNSRPGKLGRGPYSVALAW